MLRNAYPSLDFDLGETAELLRESVADFSAVEIAPRAGEIDETNDFRPISGVRWAISASSESPSSRTMAVPGWVILSMSLRWRR